MSVTVERRKLSEVEVDVVLGAGTNHRTAKKTLPPTFVASQGKGFDQIINRARDWVWQISNVFA